MTEQRYREVEFSVWGENDEDCGTFRETVRVTREEYEMLKECCRKGTDVNECKELEALCWRIEEGIIYRFALYEEYGMEHPYTFTAEMPQEIVDEVRAESTDSGTDKG